MALTPDVGHASHVMAGPRPRRVNISSLGSGGYHGMFLKAIGASGNTEVVEDQDDDTCDIYLFCPVNREELHRRFGRLRPGSRVNYFPGMCDACEKVGFCKGVRLVAAMCPRINDFVPPTWLLPDEAPAVYELLQDPHCPPFIVKPEYGLQGNGIFIVRNQVDLKVASAAKGLASMDAPRHVCQQYIVNPLTLDGFKFDLRMYVVLTSLAPLQAWLWREGIARFCTKPYSPPTAANIAAVTGHLTNYSLNSKHEGFARTQTGSSEDTASKRLLSKTLEQISACSEGRFCQSRFWDQIEEMVGLVLLAILPSVAFAGTQLVSECLHEASRCYHVLGFDVLLDANYRPWLLEVNSKPAMDIETAVPAPDAMPARENRTSLRRPHSHVPSGREQGASAVRRVQSSLSPAPSTTRRPSRVLRTSASVATSSFSKSAAQSILPRVIEHGRLGPRLKVPAMPSDLPGAAAAVHSSTASGVSSESNGSLEELPQLAAQTGSPGDDHGPVGASGEASDATEFAAKVKRKPRRRRRFPSKEEPPPPEPPRFTDPWGGYQPSLLRHRAPWPEICRCMAQSGPHRHAISEVDDHAKTSLIAGVLRLIFEGAVEGGSAEDRPISINSSKDVERLQTESVLLAMASVCGHIGRMRSGLSGHSLRRVLLASDQVLERSRANAPFGQHDVELLASKAEFVGRGLERRGGGRGELTNGGFPPLIFFHMLLDLSHRFADKDAALSELPMLQQVEWFVNALSIPPTSSNASCRGASFASLAPIAPLARRGMIFADRVIP